MPAGMNPSSPITELVFARCRLLGYSLRTAGSYAAALRQFERCSGVPAMLATQAQAAAWMLKIRGTACTLHCRRHALNFLFRGLRGEEIDRRVLPPTKRPPARAVDVPSPQEIAAILAAIPHPDQRLFCSFVYATGLRLREAVAVRFADLDLVAGTLLVRQGKGGAQRRSILPASLHGDLRRRAHSRLPEALLFPPPNGSIHNLTQALCDARRRAGVVRRVTTHTLRHGFATHLHERGIGVCELQRLLGHTSVLTTMHYLGQREGRCAELARVGDLLAALPQLDAGQQHIPFG